MMKGIQRKMIIVKTDKSDVFETAYFVLRSDADKSRSEALDMLGEANRIVNEGSDDRKSRRGKRKRFGRFAAFCFFLLGIVFGTGSSFLAWAFYTLL